jgi:peptide/nickel transport system permease protein
VERSPGYWATVGRRLLRNRLAMLAALILLALIVMAVFAPALMPADPMRRRSSSA